MNAGKQYAPLVQAGGGLDSKGLGHSLGGGGQISYGYGPAGAKFAKDVRGGYAPITRKVRPQCGSGKRRRRQRRSRRRRSRRNRRQPQSTADNGADIINIKAINHLRPVMQ